MEVHLEENIKQGVGFRNRKVSILILMEVHLEVQKWPIESYFIFGFNPYFNGSTFRS